MIFKRIDQMLTPGPRYAAFADPILRVATSLIFIIGGLGHFGRHQMMLDRIIESPWHNVVMAFGDPSWLLWLSGGIFVVFGIMLALGWMTRLSALLLLATLIPITISIHFAPGHVGPLFKNVAIMGALLFVVARGAGAYAVDDQETM